MAESISELYFRLGLDISDLNSGLVDAQKTLSENLKELNQQNNLIQLKSQVQIEGLDETAEKTEELKIQGEALNQQLAIQKDRLQLTAAAYKAMVEAQGENSDAAYNLALQLEKERLAMLKLENQAQSLADQQQVAFGMNWEMLGLIEPSMKLVDIAARGRETFTFLGRAIPIPQAKIAAAALVGLTAAISGTVEATDELAESNAPQTFSNNFQNASVEFGNSLSEIREQTIMTAKTIDGNFKSTLNNAQELQETSTTFADWARDFFRVAFLLADESDNFSDAIAKVNAQSQFMRTEFGEIAVILAGVRQTFDALANSAISFIKPSVENFRNLQRRAGELNISLSKTSDLMSLIDMAGGDYNDIRDYVRGVQDAVIKGDSEDPEVIALEKYGVAIQDSNGKLLDFNTTLNALYQGFLKAKKAGEEEAYIIMTNGQAVQDVLPFFEKLAEAEERVGKIQWATLDFDALQKTSTTLKLLETQIGEFDTAKQSLGLPLADYLAQVKFDGYRRLTELVEENRETVLKWEFVVIEALKRVQSVIDDVLDSITGKSEETEESVGRLEQNLKFLFFRSWLYPTQDMAEQLSNKIDEQYKLTEIYKLTEGTTSNKFVRLAKTLATVISGNRFNALHNTDALLNEMDMVERLQENFRRSLNGEQPKTVNIFAALGYGLKPEHSIFSDAERDLKQYIDANKKAREETEKTSEEITAGLSYSYNRIKKFKEELANIELDLEFGDYDYDKSLAKLDVWYEQVMKDAKYYAEEQSVINELYNAKAEQVEAERLRKIEEIRKQYAGSRQTELQKRLAEIEKESESWIKFGMESEEALEIAEKRKTEAIRQIEEEFLSSVNSLHRTALERRLAEIEKEKQAWIQKGIDEVQATRAAEEQKAEAIKQLEEEFLASVSSIHQTALEQRLAQIEKEKQAWIQKGIDEVRATKNAEEQKVQAQRNAAMSVLNSQLKEYKSFEQGGYEGLRDYKLKQLYKAGISPQDLYITPQQIANFQKAQQIAQNSLLPNFMTDTDKYNHNLLLQAQTDYKNEVAKLEEELLRLKLDSALGGAGKEISLDDSLRNILKNIHVEGIDESIKIEAIDLTDTLKNVKNGFEDFSTGIVDFSSNVATAIQGFSEITNYTNDVTKSFFEASQSVTDVAKNFSNLSKAVSNLVELKSEGQRQPANITTNVAINEAHAWDYSHIQDLAEKVADVMIPRILRAIGGDSNSY